MKHSYYSALLRTIVVLAIGFGLALPSTLLAQTPAASKFPENPNEFVDKLGQFMTASKRPDMEEAFSVFKKKFKANVFSEQDMRRVIAMSNLLADGFKLTPFPYFKNYMNAVSAAKSDPDTTLFNRWHTLAEEAIGGVEKGRTKPISQFLEFSVDFLEQRALKSGEGGSVTWKIRGGKFHFEYNDKQPQMRCENVDLIGVRKQDSIIIFNTSGSYSPFENLWRGSGGKVTWADAGLDSSVFVKLTEYKVESIKPLFQCDSAMMYYPLYFPGGSIAGKFEHNIVVGNKAGATQFPRFESFDKKLKITKIGEGVEYFGGFRLHGSSLYGYGSGNEPAQVTVYDKKRKKVFFGTGPLFIIKREQNIVAEGVNAKLYMDEDSLFHPAVDLRYDIPAQVISLTRGNKGSERNPFFSSFYNMNLNTDRIAWYLNRDSLEIGARAGTGKGVEQKISFESSNHFDMADYNKMQHIASQNPISTLYITWLESDQDKEDNGRLVSDDEYARRINPKFDYSSIQTLLAELVREGFINYYFDRHQIELRDKLIHYALASQGKRDYDGINIESTSANANARLDLKTKETHVRDVKKIELSNRQKVALIPYNNEFTLLKDRDMRFGGRLYAGMVLFEGSDMEFKYQQFQINFDSVRHMDFYLPTGDLDKNGQPIANAMNSTVELVSGVLLVDAPNNKSGKEDLAMFPSLQAKKHSFVFYDNPQIQKGVYTRDSFYFKLDPFSFNGLDSYTKEQLKFKGEMFPATIFPSFKETIVVRDEDKSFGFVHKTPPTGYPTYSKKGNYTGELDLSNKGFLGRGKLEYLTANIESEDLIFRPKQTTGTAKKFFMEEDRAGAVKVPQAQGENVSVNWLPFKDSMYVESKAKDFELFKKPNYFHKGTLILTPSGLKGTGVFEWSEGILTSKLISYGPFQASADTADLQIKSLDGAGFAFDSRNIDGELDFDKQIGHFKANTENATTTLPLDQYRTSMNEFTWDMQQKTIEFKADPKKPGSFVSIDPDQDTLSFTGKTAFYDLKTNYLTIGGNEVIKSADAYIYPDSADIIIEPGGKMKQLTNARIVADTVNQYHTINRATVDILGKKLYKASGYYEYNIFGYNQEVFFNDIVGERRGPGSNATKNVLTSASGNVTAEDSFRMDVKTLFKGEIILKANQRNLRFNGFAKMEADKLPGRNWFSINAQVDRTNPIIRIVGAKDEEGNPLVTGFYLSRNQGELYPRILLPAYNRVDRAILNCTGVLKYDAKNDRFTYGDSAKVAETTLRGAKMIFDNRTGIVQGEGRLSIGSELKYMKLTTSGRLKSDFNKPDSVFHTVTGEFMTGVEMTIPKALMEIMVNDIKASSFDAPAAIYNTNPTFYQPAVSEFISDDKELPEMLANLTNNLIILPKKDNKYAFVLGRHPVIWNDEYQSFLSLEDRIPLVALNGELFGKVLNIFVEYKMPGGFVMPSPSSIPDEEEEEEEVEEEAGKSDKKEKKTKDDERAAAAAAPTSSKDDRFYLYIKASSDLWYFFGYQAGALNVVSSSTRFNDALLGLKAKETQIKMPDGEIYEIVPANPSLADAFVNRVRAGRKKE
ncbi:MAG: hypothetical protein KF734_05685 [Saprospiraceae bacterium]|nr:hypothetical protein [Saprospiraceae bacterium]